MGNGAGPESNSRSFILSAAREIHSSSEEKNDTWNSSLA